MTRNESILTKNEQEMRDFKPIFQGKPEKRPLKRDHVKMEKLETDFTDCGDKYKHEELDLTN
jgi:hypothetical protein